MRSGRCDWRLDGKRISQQVRALDGSESLMDQANQLKDSILNGLDRFADGDAYLKVHGLVRTRQTEEGYASFAGFWGTLDVADQWPAIFGGGLGGDLNFRRGPWENWSASLPGFEEIDETHPLVFSPYCGTLFHEAVGHAMEEEYLEQSPLRRFIGRKLAPASFSVMDRPDLKGFAGSMSHDDIGRPATETTMVHKGFLVGELVQKHGVLRRASYRDVPQVRASNFLIGPGDADPGWLEVLPHCYYIAGIRSGNWNPGSHSIKVLTGQVFKLERGRPVAFKEWAVLHFGAVELLAGIQEVGSDLCMDPVTHWCMKKNQAVPMGMGSPSILFQRKAY